MPEFGAVLYGKDVAGLTSFYAEVMGLRVAATGDGWSQLAGEQFELVVHALPPALAADIEISSPPQRREDTPIKLCFTVANLAATRAAVARLGGELNPPEREWQRGTLRVCDGHDPEGNVFQVRMPV